MENMTNEEIKAMVGTEFNYVFSDRAYIPAVVAAFDPEIGFTCLATSLIDSNGQNHFHATDENGNFCLIGYDSAGLKDLHGKRREISLTLRSIKLLGYYKVASAFIVTRGRHLLQGGGASCSF